MVKPAQRMGANSHGSDATNITVLQSFCDGASDGLDGCHKILIINGKIKLAPAPGQPKA
jgi:hypothetical protein